MGKEIYFTHRNILNKSRRFLKELKNTYHFPEIKFEPEASSLLVIDMQKYFLDKNSHAFIPSTSAIIPNIKRLINIFQGNRPIIFTQHINTQENAGMLKKWWNDIITRKDDLYQLSDEIYSPGAPIIVKTQYDAFHKTNLKKLLLRYHTKKIVITGVMTNLCCETTARSAFVQGFEVFFVIDGTATQNEAMHKATLLNLAYGFAIPVLTQEIIKSFENKC